MLVHLFACLKMSSLSPKRLKERVLPTVSRNAFSALNQSLTSLKPPCLSMVECCSRQSAEGIRGSCRQILCCADRQSTGNRRSTQEVPKNVTLGVAVQKPGLGGLISERPAAAEVAETTINVSRSQPPQQARDRRGGGARCVGSARARAERGWGQGAGSWRPPPSEHAQSTA